MLISLARELSSGHCWLVILFRGFTFLENVKKFQISLLPEFGLCTMTWTYTIFERQVFPEPLPFVGELKLCS